MEPLEAKRGPQHRALQGMCRTGVWENEDNSKEPLHIEGSEKKIEGTGGPQSRQPLRSLFSVAVLADPTDERATACRTTATVTSTVLRWQTPPRRSLEV
eukprot:8877610-Pyramimonas_sp.AAC.1